MGMHNSRKLQLEQATLMAWGFMVYLMVERWICLGSRLEHKLKKHPKFRVYPVQVKNHQKPVFPLTSVNA
jgi:glycopeptide antibiotics resistance protein